MGIRSAFSPMRQANIDTTPIRVDPINNPNGFEYKVPTGCKKLKIDCVAAKGTNHSVVGGNGGRVQCVLNVIPGKTLYVTAGKIGGYNASDIRSGNKELSNRVVVAGGGGDAGQSESTQGTGGNGGGLVGAQGASVTRCTGGYGGSQNEGGNGAVKGQFGYGAPTSIDGNMRGGKGGDGWYGGGSGTTNHKSGHGYYAAGGGGGSSYTDPKLCNEVVHTQGFNNGNGYVILTPLKK